MTEIPSLLAHVSADDVIAEPYPHLVVENVLEEGLYRRLLEAYPPIDVLADGRPYAPNSRLNCSASRVLGNDSISPLWQEFVKAQTSPAFYSDVVRIFGGRIRELYASLPDPATLRPGIRNIDGFDERDILLDCQISANTPVTRRPGSPRTAHIDQSVKLFFGLFYFRDPADDSIGGDLELHRYRSGVPGGFLQKSTEPAKKSRSIPDAYLELLKTIRYQPNVLVLMVNSIHATHGVTVRSLTPHPRRFVNLLGDLREPIFRYDAYPDVPFLRDRVIRTAAMLRAARERWFQGTD